MFLGNLRTLQIARKCFSRKYSKTKFSIKPNIFLSGKVSWLMVRQRMSTYKNNTFDHVVECSRVYFWLRLILGTFQLAELLAATHSDTSNDKQQKQHRTFLISPMQIIFLTNQGKKIFQLKIGKNIPPRPHKNLIINF